MESALKKAAFAVPSEVEGVYVAVLGEETVALTETGAVVAREPMDEEVLFAARGQLETIETRLLPHF